MSGRIAPSGTIADQSRYLIFASIFITVKSVQEQVKEKNFTVSELFKNSLFFTLIISLLSTYILWFLVSFLFFDPWHMFTSVRLGPISLKGAQLRQNSSSNIFS